MRDQTEMSRASTLFLTLGLTFSTCLISSLSAAESTSALSDSAAIEKPKEADDGGSSFSESMGRQARLEYSLEPEADLDMAGAFSYWDVTLSAPIFGRKIGTNWLWGARIRYRYSEIDWTDQALFDNDSLHRLDLSFNLVYKPESSPWSGFLSIAPGLAGDGTNITTDELLYVVIAGAGYKFSDRFTLLGGIYFSQDFGEPRLIPSPGFIWEINDRWNFSVIPPRVRLAYTPIENWRLVAEAFPNGNRWSVTTLDGEAAYLDRSGFRAGLRIERRVIGDAWLQVSGGIVFARELAMETEGGRILFESDADPTPYISTGFFWRF